MKRKMPNIRSLVLINFVVRISLLLCYFFILSISASAQQFRATTYLELSGLIKTGTQLSYITSRKHELAVFYQESPDFANNEKTLPRFHERTFIGVRGSYLLPFKENYFNVFISTRTGVINGRHFAIKPGVLANYAFLIR